MWGRAKREREEEKLAIMTYSTVRGDEMRDIPEWAPTSFKVREGLYVGLGVGCLCGVWITGGGEISILLRLLLLVSLVSLVWYSSFGWGGGIGSVVML